MNDLLKVLDMSEDEQKQTVLDLLDEETMEWFIDYEMHLADLAFRLRDEAKKHADFHEAIYDIMVKVEGNDNWATAFWGECIAQPIHWIIAALIAKEEKDDRKS